MLVNSGKNVNYEARLVWAGDFSPHPNADRLKLLNIEHTAYRVCVNSDLQPEEVVYFPPLAIINPRLLSYCNEFRNIELNRNHDAKPGYFRPDGMVRVTKIRGFPSEGFIIPFRLVKDWLVSQFGSDVTIESCEVFDEFVIGEVSVWICKKAEDNACITYKSSKRKRPVNTSNSSLFKFHYDTILLKTCPDVIHPDDLISITSKFHGTSGISAYLYADTPKLTWIEKIFYKFCPKFEHDYEYIYASRTKIRTGDSSRTYYQDDIWKYADAVVSPYLSKGMTAYYEIVGFTPSGEYIQKDYDYGCDPPVHGIYLHDINFKVYIYRITLTTINGYIHEFSAREVQQWCKANGLRPVQELYYGYARDLVTAQDSRSFGVKFIETISKEGAFNRMELRSPDCKKSVPHEGLVIRIEDMHSCAYKVKCFNFIQKESESITQINSQEHYSENE